MTVIKRSIAKILIVAMIMTHVLTPEVVAAAGQKTIEASQEVKKAYHEKRNENKEKNQIIIKYVDDATSIDEQMLIDDNAEAYKESIVEETSNKKEKQNKKDKQNKEDKQDKQNKDKQNKENKQNNKDKKIEKKVQKQEEKRNNIKQKAKDILKLKKVETKKTFKTVNAEVIEIDATDDIDEVVALLNDDPNVAYAQPNYKLSLFEIPNDELFQQQWALYQEEIQVNDTGDGIITSEIRAVEAWEYIDSKAAGVTVGILVL